MAAEGQFFLAMVVGQKAEVPDSWKAGWDGVDQKTADELEGGQRHVARVLFMFMAVILPLKSDLAAIDRQNALIGERHPVGVAAEVFEHLL